MKSDIISITVSFNKWAVTFKLQVRGTLSLILLWNKEWRISWLEALIVKSTKCCLHVFKYVIWMIIGHMQMQWTTDKKSETIPLGLVLFKENVLDMFFLASVWLNHTPWLTINVLNPQLPDLTHLYLSYFLRIILAPDNSVLYAFSILSLPFLSCVDWTSFCGFWFFICFYTS